MLRLLATALRLYIQSPGPVPTLPCSCPCNFTLGNRHLLFSGRLSFGRYNKVIKGRRQSEQFVLLYESERAREHRFLIAATASPVRKFAQTDRVVRLWNSASLMQFQWPKKSFGRLIIPNQSVRAGLAANHCGKLTVRACFVHSFNIRND
jgi:hypothetical protein